MQLAAQKNKTTVGISPKLAAGCYLLLTGLPLLAVVFGMASLAVHRHLILERLERQSLTILFIEKGQPITWRNAKREIVLAGRFFDVKQVEHLPNGRTKIIGIFDTVEKELEQIVDHLATAQLPASKCHTLGLILLLGSIQPIQIPKPASKTISVSYIHFVQNTNQGVLGGFYRPPLVVT